MRANLWFVGSLALFAGLWLGAAAERSVRSAPARTTAPLLLTAHRMDIVDDLGQPRMTLDADAGSDHETTVTLYGVVGRSSLILDDSKGQDPKIVMASLDGTPSFVINAGVKQQALGFADRASHPVVTLDATESGGHAATYPPNTDKPNGQLP